MRLRTVEERFYFTASWGREQTNLAQVPDEDVRSLVTFPKIFLPSSQVPSYNGLQL